VQIRIERAWVNNVRQTEMRTAEPLAPERRTFEFETANGKLKCHKSPGIDQVPVERLNQGLGQFALRTINLLIILVIRRHILRIGRSVLV
jgi:hypothetical protein